MPSPALWLVEWWGGVKPNSEDSKPSKMCELTAYSVSPIGRTSKGRLVIPVDTLPSVAAHSPCTSHTRWWLFSKFTINVQTTQWLWRLFHWFEYASSFFLLTFRLCWVKSNLPLLVSKIWIQAFSCLCLLSTLSASLLERFAYLSCVIIRSIHV